VVCRVYLVAGDGSNSTYVADGIEPAWDGSRVAFVDYGQPSISMLNGTGFVRLTSDPGGASAPVFSVDGSKIGFGTADAWLVIKADGSGIAAASRGDFAWPAGARTVFVLPFGGACQADGHICADTIYISNGDGTYTAIAHGNNPAWALPHQPLASPVSHGCDGLVCAFDASGSWITDSTTIVNYAWKFGDGTTGSGRQASHAYAASGTYSVTLTAMMTAGVTGTKTASVDVVGNRWPTASFTYSCSGSQCSFDGSGSSDPDGEVANYFWSFGDGGAADGTAVNHRYAAVGTFTTTLVVTDNGGATRSQQQTVTITSLSNTPPVALSTRECAGLMCTFSALLSTDSDGTITRYAWNFGDGTLREGAIVAHTYAAPGSYAVTLSVTDNLGATGTQTQIVTAVRADSCRRSRWPGHGCAEPVERHCDDHRSRERPLHGGRRGGDRLLERRYECHMHDDCRGSVRGEQVWPCEECDRRLQRLKPHAGGFRYNSGDNHDPDGDSKGGAITVTRR
jgi:PKD repeat protein